MFESWFTNTCEAFVDEKGQALFGEELERARMNPKTARRCGHLVRIGAKCCRYCGAPTPGFYWKCQNCGANVSNETRVCTECKAPQSQQNRACFIDGIWRPQRGIFAQRFELNAIRDSLKQGLDIQDGQAAILLVGGEEKDVLPPGNYTLDEILAPAGGAPVRCSLVMLRLGEQEFPLKLDGMRTADNLEISLNCLVFLQFDHEKAASFMSSLVGNPDYTDGDIQSCTLSCESIAFHVLLPELDATVRQFCAKHMMAELFLAPALRNDMEAALRNALDVRLTSTGLRFCRVTGIDFSGAVYEELCRTQGELEQRRRELQFQLEAEKLTQDHEKQSAQADMEHERFLKQLAQEMKISDLLRDQELHRVQAKIELDKALEALEQKYQQARKEQHDMAELEKLDTQHQEELKALVQDGEIARRQKEHAELLRQRLEEQKTALQISVMEAEMTITTARARHTVDMLELEKEKKARDIAREDEGRQIENYNKASMATLMALAKDPVTAHNLLELVRIETFRNMTPEQIRASQGMAAAPERRKDTEYDELQERIMKLNAEQIQTIERIATKAMESNAQAARGNATTTQVFK